jgi:hypothetical protein
MASPEKFRQVTVEHIGSDDLHPLITGKFGSEVRCQVSIHLHGHHSTGSRRQKPGQRPPSGSDLQYRLAGKDTCSSDDPEEDIPVGQKILAESLAGTGKWFRHAAHL